MDNPDSPRPIQAQPAAKDPVHILRYRDIVLNLVTRHATRGDRQLGLTDKEFDLLGALVRNKGKILSPRELYKAAGGHLNTDRYDPSNIIATHLSHLRRRLGAPAVIDHERKAGYGLMGADIRPPPQPADTPQPANDTVSYILQHEDITLDLIARQATRAGALLDLRNAEFKMLTMLIENKGKTVSTRELYKAMDGGMNTDNYDPTGTVRAQICRLREKLGAPNVIKTVPWRGYEIENSTLAPQKGLGGHIRKTGGLAAKTL